MYLYVYVCMHVHICVYIYQRLQMCRTNGKSGQHETYSTTHSGTHIVCADQSGYTAAHCNTLQRSTARCNTLQHNAAYCSMLQHTAACCSTLQHTAACCSTLQHPAACWSTLQHTAACCSTLQHTAACCSTLQYTAIHYNTPCVSTHDEIHGEQLIDSKIDTLSSNEAVTHSAAMRPCARQTHS